MEISKKLQNYSEKNNIQNIINDCESIINEIKAKELKISFVIVDNMNGTKKKQLQMRDKKGIIVIKDYATGPDSLELIFKNNKLSI